MVITTKTRIQEILILLFLVLFPFGQFLRTEFWLGSYFGVLHPIDAVVGLSAVFYILFVKKDKLFTSVSYLFYYLLFGLVLSLRFFKPGGVVEGLFYAVRLFSYLTFPLFLASYFKENKKITKFIDNYLLGAMGFVAIIGWVQYILFPDVRFLYYLGWDDHLYRIIGSFLDPGFLAILLAFSALLSLYKYFHQKKKIFLAGFFIFLVTLLFTYARSGYVAFGAGLLYLLLKEKKKLLLGLMAIVFSVGIILLPRPGGEGVKLERLYSVYLRMQNYEETVSIFKENPLIGVGYNNMCLSRFYYLGDTNTSSHACSGSDASILLVLSTMGVVGILVLLGVVINFKERITLGSTIINTLFITLIIHSLFVNSLFYPWVLGFIGVIYAKYLSISNTEE